MNERNLATRRVDLSPPSTVMDCLLIRNNNCSFVSSIHLLHTVNQRRTLVEVEKAEKAERSGSPAPSSTTGQAHHRGLHAPLRRPPPAMVGTTATAIIAASTVPRASPRSPPLWPRPDHQQHRVHQGLGSASTRLSQRGYMNGGGILGGGAGDVRQENPLLLIYLSTHE